MKGAERIMVVLIVALVGSTARAENPLRGRDQADELRCVYLRGHEVRMDRAEEHENEAVSYRCKTFSDYEADGRPEMVYELPRPVLNQLDTSQLQSGISVLTIRGCYIHRIPRRLDDPDKIICRKRVSVEVANETHRRLTLRRKGTSKVVVVRVTSRDSQVSYSAETLATRIFDPDIVSFRSQYKACSNNQLEFVPATGEGITNGVGELFFDEDLVDQYMSYTVENDLLAAFVDNFGSTDNFDHILFCMPNNMAGDWIGYTYGQTYRSWYNNDWCGYYTLHFHEVGHNLGLQHSNEGGEEYEDRSCQMGKSYPRNGSPQMCFNGVKFAQLDWFPEHMITIDPTKGPWTGSIAAFVDVAKLSPGTIPIIVRVSDTFLVFNRAKDYNDGVVEKANMVTIAQGSAEICDGCESEMLAGVREYGLQKDFTVDLNFASGTARVTFEACARQQDGEVDTMAMSIRLADQPSTCSTDVTEPVPAPMLKPTPSPVPPPTQRPSPPPTSSPTNSPTSPPTRNPTPNPTSPPTLSPTKAPTKAPTLAPTSPPSRNPTPSPIFPPTPSPTKAPSPAPTSPPSRNPTPSPTFPLSPSPTKAPTPAPSSPGPTTSPTPPPSPPPTPSPTNAPITEQISPTASPTLAPTSAPSPFPTTKPTSPPTPSPPPAPTLTPTSKPMLTTAPQPTGAPTSIQSSEAAQSTPEPTAFPTPFPTPIPTPSPTALAPTPLPTAEVSDTATLLASEQPTVKEFMSPAIAVPESPSEYASPEPTMSLLGVIATESPTYGGPYCDDSDFDKFFVPSLNVTERCVWLQSRPDYFDEVCSTEEGQLTCPETCKICSDNCEDLGNKFYVGGDERNCLWLRLRPELKPDLCQSSSEFALYCGETCDICDGPQTAAVPTTPYFVPPTSAPVTPAPVAPVLTLVCDDDKFTLFYVPSEKQFQTCIWLAARPDDQATLCLPDHPSNAYTICEETCRKCSDDCWDTQGKFLVGEEVRDCTWLSIRPLLHADLCTSDKDPYTKCPETCDVCDLPAELRTDPPTSAPMLQGPDVYCDDDKFANFYVEDLDEDQRCVWLAARPEYVDKLCPQDSTSGARDVCPETCKVCRDDCNDSDTKFYIGEDIRDCLWLSLRPERLAEFCANKDITKACPETCDLCDASPPTTM